MYRFTALFLLLLLLHPASSRAQEAADGDSTNARRWTRDLKARLAGSQAGYHNWSEGGVNTLAGTASLTGKASRQLSEWQTTLEGRLAFGVIKQDTLRIRKADDVIRLLAALQYHGDGFFRTFNPTASVALRTQFAAGFNYDKDPFEEGRPLPVKVSDFFAPATMTQTLGLTYDPSPWFTQRLGVAAKETIVGIERLAPLYGLKPGESVRWELGIESRSELDRELFENVRLKSSLGLFASFNKPDMPDLLWENLLTMQVNAWLGVNLEVVTVFDQDISEAVQVKEVLSIGVSLDVL